MDIETARANMIEQQIRPWNVLAMQTLDALKGIRREDFVPAAHREMAFADVQIPLGGGEVMLEPKVSARMLEALDLGAGDRVLEIGTGSGYLTALLASLSAHVTSVEIDRGLLDAAQRNLAKAGIANVTLANGDAHAGWSGRGEAERFNAILIGGSLPTLGDSGSDSGDDPWLNILADGGRLVGIEGHLPAMTVVRLRKTSDPGNVLRESLFETVAPRLRNVSEPPEFTF